MKRLARYFALFCCTAAVLLSALIGSALIPRGAIERNMRASADYLAARPLFPELMQGVRGSVVDRYADAILLNIAWHYDARQPLRSVMRSAYYHTDVQGENVNLRDAVYGDLPATQQYLRYWHGSIALLRPLLTALSLPQIYALHGALLTALALWLLVVLWRRCERAAAVGVLAGLIATTCWFVPLSLEYYWVYLLSLALSLSVLRLTAKGAWERAAALFLVSGMATAYLDFLTAETLTLTLPLLLLVWLRRRDGASSPLDTAWRAALAWCCGWVGMWLAKWLLASLALGESALPYVVENAGERAGGAVDGLSPLGLALGAIRSNIACLFPMGWGLAGALVGLALLFCAVYCGCVYRRPGRNKMLLVVCAAVGFLPFVRYLLLRSHSYIHCFFTCRALLATVLALALILAELTERGCGNAVRQRKRA